jgi:hypothetical protein
VGSVSPATIPANGTGIVTVFVTNSGDVAANGPLSITVNPSSDGVDPLDLVLGSLVKRVRLEPNKKTKFVVHIKALSNLPAGNYDSFVAVTLNGASATAVGQQFSVS